MQAKYYSLKNARSLFGEVLLCCRKMQRKRGEHEPDNIPMLNI